MKGLILKQFKQKYNMFKNNKDIQYGIAGLAFLAYALTYIYFLA